MYFLKKIAPEYAVSFCLLHPALDKKKRSKWDQTF